MKRNIIQLFCVSLLLLMSSCVQRKKSIQEVVVYGLNRSVEHATAMMESMNDYPGRLPKSIKDGLLETSDRDWWCSGFFPGELWYLYEYTGSSVFKEQAMRFTELLDSVQYVVTHHDVGFMLNCSYGNGYRLIGDTLYCKVLLNGAKSLSTRYNPLIKAIRSWDFTNDGKWQYPVIIDNMMNLELLEWASKKSGDRIFSDIANNHAQTTLKNHFRDDYSSYHVVSYDTITGLPHIKMTHQGYSDESVWARGQAWGLYGYTMMARETSNKLYLRQAEQIANMLISHPNMPADKIPYWDFEAPNIPNEPRDASAAAIMASALISLSQLVESEESCKYLEFAEDQIRSLSSPEYLAEPGTNCNFILKHSTGNKPGNSEIDVPLSYADYYYVEALMKLKSLMN